MTLQPGARLGPYEVLSALGAGGMGEVYRARDSRVDHRVVALKVLRSHLADDPDRRARFKREASAISQLAHPNVCVLHDVGRHEGSDYLVLEYLDGQTLAERVEKGPLPIDQALRVAIEIANALDAAHRAGIVHRDLKPANVMLTKSGAKLLDFGIARLAAPPAGSAIGITQDTLTAEGTLLGTLHYMSPEQLEGRDADPRSDIFAFGAVVYEMVIGRRAFPGETPSKVIAAVMEGVPPRMVTMQPNVPAALDHLVMTCLAKNADDRWQNASDIRRQLEWTAAATTTASRDPHPNVRRFTRNAALASALAALALAAMAVWALWKAPAPYPRPREARLEISTPPVAVSREASLAISPDGSTVAFVGESDGQSLLWLRPLDGLARPVPGTVGAVDPFWSPDSQSLGFFADGKLKRVDRRGSAAQILADAINPQGGSWGRDGTIVFSPHQLSALLRVPAAGGDVTTVTALAAGQTGHVYAHLMPDDVRVLYFATGNTEVQGVYISGLDGSSAKRLLTGTSPAVYVPSGYLLFVRDDVLLAQAFDLKRLELTGDAVSIVEHVAVGSLNQPAVSVSNAGDIVYRGVTGRAQQLTWLDRSGTTIKRIGDPDSTRNGDSWALSPDGRRVALQRRRDGKSDLWLVDLDRDGVMNRLTLGGKESAPLWSRDGLRVTYSSTRNGHLDIFEASADGARDEPLLLLPYHHVPASWSPDGHVLLFLSADTNPDLARNTHLDIWAVRTGTEEQPFPVVQSPLEDINPELGPEATWIVYQSNVSSRYEVYIRNFPGPGAPVPISTNGGTQPRLRSDGRELFYISLDHWLMAVPIAVSAEGRLIKAGTPGRLFQTRIGGPESDSAQRQYEVTPDGQRFLFDLPVEYAGAPLVLIQNWRP